MLNYPIQNLANIGRTIYLFNRYGNDLRIQKDVNFFPYYYVPSPNGIFRGYFGGKFNKIFCKEPYLIKDKRNVKVDGESDIVYVRRYLLDKVNIIKSRTKWIMFDIETQSKIMPNSMLAPDPITCITVYCNYDEKYETFYLPNYNSEYEMISAFIDYIKKQQVDLLIAYNSENFDAPYLINRFSDFAEAISPINRIKKRNGYPEGISIVDYYKLIKKVYKYKRHSLDFIYSEEFKEPQDLKKYRFDIINEEIKEKNKHDVYKMVRLEDRFHLIDYFDEIRRITKVLWDDLCNYSVAIDGLILQTAKSKGLVLPSKPDEEERIRRIAEDEIVGGYVYAKPGRYEGVTLLDISGTYPSLIVTFNLDPANKRKESNDQTVTIRKIHIAQNSNAIVPTVSNRLINSRQQIQKELETKTGAEYDLLKKQDEAHKSLNNTLYGILLFKNSRIYDKDIADSITYLARFLIRYTKYALRLNGYEVVASDTDSIFVHSKDYEKIEKLCNEVLVKRWLTHFGKKEGRIKFKYEGIFENIVFEAPKHYKGNFITAKGEHKPIDKGIEIVRKDSSKFQEQFLEELYGRILKGESQEIIAAWILVQIKELPNKPLKEIAFPFQISQIEYKSIPIFMRAVQYTDEIIPNFSQDYHNELYYIYVKPFGTAERHAKSMRKNKETGKKELKESHTIVDKDVLAFDEKVDHIKEVNYEEMIRRNILDKAEKLFDALGWNKELIGIVSKKKIKEIENKELSEIDKQIEELQKKKEQLQQTKFAGEVSKKTCVSSRNESSVQVANPAPIKVSIPKVDNYNKAIELNELEIRQIDYSLAKIYIKENHYSHTIPSSVKVSIGFYYKGELKTAIIYGCPVGRNVTNWLQVEHSNCLELVRLFSMDDMPKNTESYCIGKSFQFLKQKYPQYKYLISYADPNHGHCGYIYQATNWKYVGIQRRLLKERKILIDGKEVHARTLNAEHGSTSDSKLKEIYGDRLEIFGAMKKYVYLMCLGNHKECKEWYSKFTFLPYPKAHNDIIEGKAQ